MLAHLAGFELWESAERGTINVSHPVINHHCCQHHHRQTRIQTRTHTDRHTDIQNTDTLTHNKCFPSSHKSPLLSTASQTDTYTDAETSDINRHCCQHHHRQTGIQAHRHRDTQTHRQYTMNDSCAFTSQYCSQHYCHPGCQYFPCCRRQILSTGK